MLVTKAPTKVFTKGDKIFAYRRFSGRNDVVYVTNYLTNESYIQALSCSYCDILISPNNRIALVWNYDSQLYIYSIGNDSLILNHVYNGSLTNSAAFTEIISFSSDSQLAIL
jgi:hypothetical protein